MLVGRWVYKTENELGGSSHWGQLATYSGAGNVQNLGSNKSDSTDIINSLYDNLWVRRGTRAVFIDFTVYNANINLFCVIRYVAEVLFLHLLNVQFSAVGIHVRDKRWLIMKKSESAFFKTFNWVKFLSLNHH